ncbi:PhaM family polyhydroxyalkanoate granule multifunctional regulatory protein [Methylibium sp.]|uniref:PhaM family polyhydroxyalkanoate granule multifunctional regulatory protein n=1 Tax=Methylibium sp. TaxID=2067992 RepID=UPI003D0EEAD8
MTATPDFAKLVPGFDFLQGLVKNAGSVLPNIGQWVAPTLNPEELEKRIEELRTVQFWLEQNARMLGATIQALEVQRMTLSTLKTMNVQVADLRESLRIKLPEAAEEVDEAPVEADAAPAAAWPNAKAPAPSRTKAKAAAAPVAGVVDPTQWWGALTKQFTQLAASTMKDVAADSAQQLAGKLVKQGFDAAEQTLKAGMAPAHQAAEAAGNAAKRAARPAKAAGKGAAAKKAAPARKAAARRR